MKPWIDMRALEHAYGEYDTVAVPSCSAMKSVLRLLDVCSVFIFPFSTYSFSSRYIFKISPPRWHSILRSYQQFLQKSVSFITVCYVFCFLAAGGFSSSLLDAACWYFFRNSSTDNWASSSRPFNSSSSAMLSSSSLISSSSSSSSPLP